MEKRWFYGLQSFRAILFIMVYISHSGNFFHSIGVWGAAAVEGFFILSGFLGGDMLIELISVKMVNLL